MVDIKGLEVIIENDCGELYASFAGDKCEEYFCETFTLKQADGLNYYSGFTDGYKAAMNKIRGVTYG